MKNKFILGFISAIIVTSFIGCAGLLGKNEGVYGKTSKKETAAGQKIDTKDAEIKRVDEDRLTSIGAWSSGVEYSLNKSINSDPAIETGIEINKRVQALAEKPTLEELQEVYNIIDSLLTNQIVGKKMLAEKDKEIIKLQTHVQGLADEKENAINRYRNLAETSARITDQYKTTLSEMDSFWGFGAIKYGITKLISRLALALGIGLVLFIAMRILAQTSPIAASVFAIFEHVGSWMINAFSKILPKSTSIAGFIPQEDYQGYKTTLHKIVDAIEIVKSKVDTLKKSGDSQQVTIDDLSIELAKSLDSQDSIRIDTAKKDLLWKK